MADKSNTLAKPLLKQKKQDGSLYSSLILAIIGLISLGMFLSNSASGPTGFADSDEIITSSLSGGFVHPSGYVILSHLIEWWGKLFVHNQVLWVNRLTALVMAISIVVMYLVINKSINLLRLPYSQSIRTLGIIIAVTIFATHPFTLLLSGITEVVQLASVLMLVYYLMVISLLIRWRQTQKISYTLLFFTTATFCLAGFYHHLIFLLLPGSFIFGWWLYHQTLGKRGVLIIMLGFLSALTLTIFLTLTRDNQAIVSWEFIRSPQGLWHYLSRQDFSGVHQESGQYLASYFKGLSLPMTVQNTSRFISTFVISLPYLFFWLGTLPGLVILISHRQTIFAQILLTNAMASVFLLIYLFFPDTTYRTFYYHTLLLNLRMYFLAFISLGLVSGIGFVWCFYKINSILTKALSSRLSIIVITVATLLPVVSLVRYGFNYNQPLRQNWLVQLTNQTLEKAEDNVVICFSDISCFSLLLTKSIQPEKYKASIIPVTPQIRQKGVNEVNFSTHNYGFNPDRIADIIFTQIQSGKKVFATEIDSYYIEALGMESQLLHLLPQEHMLQISCNLPYELELPSQELSLSLSNIDSGSNHPLLNMYREYAADNHEINATILGRMGKKFAAAKEIEMGLTLSTHHSPLISLAQKIPYYAGSPQYQVTDVCRSSEYWYQLSKQCKEAQDVQCQLRYLWWATLLSPQNASLKLEYANLLDLTGNRELADIERGHALKVK